MIVPDGSVIIPVHKLQLSHIAGKFPEEWRDRHRLR